MFTTVRGDDFNPEEHEPNKLHELLAGAQLQFSCSMYHPI
jgi:hypothetical protein